MLPEKSDCPKNLLCPTQGAAAPLTPPVRAPVVNYCLIYRWS